MATVYKQVSCPKCGKHLYSALVSKESVSRTSVMCSHCKIKYCIDFGMGKAKISKA